MSETVTKNTPAWEALYDAHVLYIKELATVNQSFLIFRVVGINTKSLKGAGTEFIRFAAMLGQRNFVTGIESLFERKDDGAGLCSIRGLLSLAKDVPLNNSAAHAYFVQKYGVQPTSNWMEDVEKVLKKERQMVKSCLGLTSKIRNNRVAHLAQPVSNADVAMLPSLDASEKIIAFAYDFYCFIACGFLNSQGADLPDKAGRSLFELIRKKFELPSAEFALPTEISDKE